MARRGYWGDIVVSPYITFGIECTDQRFFKKTNNMLTAVSLVCCCLCATELYILWSDLSQRKLSPTLATAHYCSPDNVLG